MTFRKETFIVFSAYAILAVILFPHYKYFVDSPDALQYIVIAQKYSAGNFGGAINSFWSPLFSWLLSVFLLSGIEPFFLAKVLQLIIGAFAILGIIRLISHSDNKIIFYVILFSVIVFVLSCALLVLTADLLFLTLTIWLAVLFCNQNGYVKNISSAFIFGILGALLYFSKSIGFTFFIASFTSFNLYLNYKKAFPLKTLFAKYIFTMIVFLGLSSVWICLISKKENKFVISSAASYNFFNIGPQSNPDVFSEVRHPYSWQGLIPPAHESSLCSWEEPHKMNLEKWSPLSDSYAFKHYLRVIGKNILSIRSFYFGLDAGTILLLGLMLLWFYKKESVKNIFWENIILIILCLCCTLPYVFLLVMERYVWINMIAIAILTVFVLRELTKKNKTVGILFLFIFMLLFIRQPVIELRKYYNEHETIFNDRTSLSEYVKGETASIISSGENPDEHYAKSTLVSYFANEKYFGILSVPKPVKSMQEELNKFKVVYLLSWNDSAAVPDSIYSAVEKFSSSGVSVYKLK